MRNEYKSVVNSAVPIMVLYQIAVVDPDCLDAGSSVFHLVSASFEPEDSISDVFIYFSSTIFQEVLPGTNTEAIISRGLKSVRFYGIEPHGRQQRKLDVRTFELPWNEICNGFNPLVDVTFNLHPKPRIEKQTNGETGAMFNIFLTPVNRRIALQSQESSQRGSFLPLYYLDWTELSKIPISKFPYVEKQWNSTVDTLFASKDIKYRIEVIKNPDHTVYKFIALFSLLLKKLNFRWSKIIRLEASFKSCFLFDDFFKDTKRPYSGDDDENDLREEGWWQILLFSIFFYFFHPN
jgi:hypothetical protein